jgi:hypothetical protein
MSIATARPSSIAAYLNGMGWLDEPVVAAGQLRQGRAFVDLPWRRTKLLPRHFVLAVTATRVVAFKAWGDEYALGIRPGVCASFARNEVSLAELPDGSRSKGATMCVRGERFTVSRPNPDGDWDSEELFALLGGLAPVRAPLEPAWAAFSL